MITHLAGGNSLPPEVVEHIVTKTDGVPLYVEELTKMLLESGVLRQETAQYVLTGPLSTVMIPATLQDSLMARLDRLAGGREVAQLGAVLGREFTYEMLQAFSSRDDKTLQAGLAELVHAELLYRRGRPPQATYIFKHALIQDAAYTSLLRSSRQRLHAQVAQLFATRFPATVGTQPELLAHHYTEAGLPREAVGYWHKAGQRAVERSANMEAITHLTKGVEVLKTLPETSERIQSELDLLITMGPALIATKGYTSPDVEQVYNRAYDLCRHAGEAAQRFSVLTGLRRFYQVRGELGTAREIGEQLLSLAQRQHDTTLLLEAYWSLSGRLFHLGELALVHQYLDQAVAIYEAQDTRSHTIRHGTIPGIHCLGWLSRTLWMRGYADQALQRIHEALTLARQQNSPFALQFVLVTITVIHSFRREWSLTQEYAESLNALQKDEVITSALAQTAFTVLEGCALVMQGTGEQGIPLISEWLDRYEGRNA